MKCPYCRGRGTIISPEQSAKLAQQLTEAIMRAHQEFIESFEVRLPDKDKEQP